MKDNDLSRRTFLKIAGASPLLSLIPSSFTSSNPHSALDVYGGKKAVVNRMDIMTKEELNRWKRNGRMPEIISYMEGNQEITPEMIHAVADGKEKVDYAFYEPVGQFKLDIDIHKVLGKPHFKDKATREYWESKSGKMKPECYVSLIAHEELACTC